MILIDYHVLRNNDHYIDNHNNSVRDFPILIPFLFEVQTPTHCVDITPFTLTWDGLRLYLFAVFFIIAGIAHIVAPKFFLEMIPFLPSPRLIVILTGFIEIGLAIGLLFVDFRMIVVWLAIAYLLAIYPGNIYMALNHEKFDLSKTALYIRLPFQFLFIWWVYSLLFI